MLSNTFLLERQISELWDNCDDCGDPKRWMSFVFLFSFFFILSPFSLYPSCCGLLVQEKEFIRF